MKDKEPRTIATTSTDGITYQDYVDWCFDNDETPFEEDSQYVKDWIATEANHNWEADLENIKYHRPYNVPVLLTGRLGLWNGNPSITPHRFESVYDAIQACIGNSINDVDVTWESYTIVVRAHHHDGTNVFTIEALSAVGQRKQEYDTLNRRDVKRLPYIYE